MNKIIITGVTGFLGSNIAKYLLNKGEYILGISRSKAEIVHENYCHEKWDLEYTPLSTLECKFRIFKPNYIYHYAADPIVKHYNNKLSQTNIIPTHRLLDACPKDCKFIFASSATVYGPHSTFKGTRDSVYPNDTVYALSKRYCEQLIEYYSANYLIKDYLILRYVAHAGGSHGLVYDIVQKLKSENPILELIGDDPGSEKPILHIDDSVKETIFRAETSNGIYNIAPDKECITVREVANTIMHELNIQKPIKWLGKEVNWPGDQEFVCLESFCQNIRESKQVIKDYVQSIK